MVDIDKIISQIKNVPESGVDVGIRQGYAALNAQRENPVDKETLDKHISWVKEYLADLIQKAQPLKVPSDYIYFLEYYGGLWILRDEYYFGTFGVGPMTEVWYSSVVSDDADPNAVEYGFLSIGLLSFGKSQREEQQIYFFIDLKGHIRKQSIIGVPLNKEKQIYPSLVIRNLPEYQSVCQIVSDSFTEWLEQAVRTQGTFGYLN